MKFKSYKQELSIKLVMAAIIILIVVIGANFYISRDNLYKEYYKTQQKAVSRSVSTLKQIDVGYQIVNQNMEEKMKNISHKLVKEYQQKGGNFSDEYLKELNKKYKVSDIYLINKQGVLEKSTLKENKGLNLVEIVGEEFGNFLDRVRKGNKVVADDLSVELGTGKLKKFTYQPTPDHKYIINLGWYVKDYNQQINKTSFREVVNQMKQEDDLISEIRLFDVNGLRALGDNNYEVPEDHKEKITRQLIENNSEKNKLKLEKDNKHYVYKLVKLKSRDRNRILQIVFSKESLVNMLKRQGIINLAIFLVGIIVSVLGAYMLSKDIVKPINQLTAKIKKFGDGDLTIRLDEDNDNEFGKLARSFNQAIKEQRNLISSLLDNIENLSAYSEELSASAEEGNVAIEQTSELIEDMSASIEQISASTQEVTSFAQESTSKTEVGSQNITRTVTSMQKIGQAVGETVTIINELDNNSQQIGEIVDLINNIAEQTNLLALNAAIEAARANEHGQGFAVVADEIRELATDTHQATEEIAALIEDTQDKSEAGLKAIKQVRKKVELGEEITQETGEVFEEIETASEETSVQIQQTASATQELAQNSDKIMSSTEDIDNMSDEITDSAQELANMAQDLRRLIAKFKIQR
ncbi:hypothetical protein JCM16358_12200 [Halanaerocella petrolearia]